MSLKRKIARRAKALVLRVPGMRRSIQRATALALKVPLIRRSAVRELVPSLRLWTVANAASLFGPERAISEFGPEGISYDLPCLLSKESESHRPFGHYFGRRMRCLARRVADSMHSGRGGILACCTCALGTRSVTNHRRQSQPSALTHCNNHRLAHVRAPSADRAYPLGELLH